MRFQSDTPPWNPNNVGVVQDQTWASNDDYVHQRIINISEESIQGSAEGTYPAETEGKNDEENKKKKKKKSRKTNAENDAKGDSKKDGKDGETKKKDHGPKGHRHGHGHSGVAA
jgi:hypothetical protein